MSTITVTRGDITRRTRSLSLIALHSSPLLNLPSELVIYILELALLDSNSIVLALISKTIRNFIDTIVYRTIVLDSRKTISRLHRTATSKSPAFCHVRRLAIIWTPEDAASPLHHQLQAIVAACSELRTLAAPSLRYAANLAVSNHIDGPTELIIESFEDISSLLSPSCNSLHPQSTVITHLRICEPSDGWCSPSMVFAPFGFLPHLSHLQLARRSNSNEENDFVFTEEIRSFLLSHPALKVLVVTIFNGQPWLPSTTVMDSNIWNLISEVCSVDKRVILSTGEYGAWRQEWTDKKSFRTGSLPVNFWMLNRCHSENIVDI